MTPTELREILNLLIDDRLKKHVFTNNEKTFEYTYGILEPETFLSIKSEMSELVENLGFDVSFLDEENELLIEFAVENQDINIYRLFQNNDYGNTLYRDVEVQLQNDTYRSYFEIDIMATAMSSLNREDRNAISSGIHNENPYYKKRYFAIRMSIISSIVTVGSATLFLIKK